MALTDKLTHIADAIRGKTGKTDSLTLDQMATEIAGIQAGADGDRIEMGEITITNPAGYFLIPVSSKKKHVVLRPTSIIETMKTSVKGYVYLVYATEDEGQVQACLPAGAEGGMKSQASYWYNYTTTDIALPTFSDTQLRINIGYTKLGPGTYDWYTW